MQGTSAERRGSDTWSSKHPLSFDLHLIGRGRAEPGLIWIEQETAKILPKRLRGHCWLFARVFRIISVRDLARWLRQRLLQGALAPPRIARNQNKYPDSRGR